MVQLQNESSLNYIYMLSRFHVQFKLTSYFLAWPSSALSLWNNLNPPFVFSFFAAHTVSWCLSGRGSRSWSKGLTHLTWLGISASFCCFYGHAWLQYHNFVHTSKLSWVCFNLRHIPPLWIKRININLYTCFCKYIQICQSVGTTKVFFGFRITLIAFSYFKLQ